MLAPRIMGIEKRKENFNATSLFKPTPKPAIIVIPDLEVPGIKEIA